MKGSSVSLVSSSVKDWMYCLDSLLSASSIFCIPCTLHLNWIILSSHPLSSSLPALWHDICLLQYQHVEDRSILYSWTAWTYPFQPFLYCLYDREGISLTVRNNFFIFFYYIYKFHFSQSYLYLVLIRYISIIPRFLFKIIF